MSFTALFEFIKLSSRSFQAFFVLDEVASDYLGDRLCCDSTCCKEVHELINYELVCEDVLSLKEKRKKINSSCNLSLPFSSLPCLDVVFDKLP